MRELILLKVIEVKNAWFAAIDFLIMHSNFKILYAMVAIMLSVNLSDIAIITIKNVDHHSTIYNISKSKAINFIKTYILEYCEYI